MPARRGGEQEARRKQCLLVCWFFVRDRACAVHVVRSFVRSFGGKKRCSIWVVRSVQCSVRSFARARLHDSYFSDSSMTMRLIYSPPLTTKVDRGVSRLKSLNRRRQMQIAIAAIDLVDGGMDGGMCCGNTMTFHFECKKSLTNYDAQIDCADHSKSQ